MKVFELKLRLISPVVVICCFVSIGGQSLQAQQTISFPNFNSTAGLQINGNAAVVTVGGAKVLRLTPAATSQVGTAWSTATLPLAQGFSTTFTFQLTQPGGIGAADGFAFVVQNGSFPNESSGSSALGSPFTSGGGGIGFQGLTKSLAIEFDTFNNPTPGLNGDISGNEIAVQSCGTFANTAIHGSCTFGSQADPSTFTTPIILTDGNPHTAVITYTPPTGCSECLGTLAITLDSQMVLTTGFDLASLGLDSNQDAFVGFTAATGAGDENHDILSWSLTANQQTVTLGPPGTTATLTFNTDTYKITGVNNIGGEQLTVTAFLVPASSFPAGFLPSFPGERCIPYGDYSFALGVDTCVEFQATCSGGTCSNNGSFIYLLATGYDLPSDLSGGIGGPDFLVAHGQSCPLTNSSTVQSIFLSYEATIKDPTTKGGSLGPSCFVATYTPGATPITTGTASRFAGWESPVANNELNQVKAGSTRPLPFQFFDILGNPVTNLSLCNSFTATNSGNVCNDSPAVPKPWVNLASFGITCPNGTSINTATDGTLSFPGNSGLLNNGAGSYQLNWQTKKLWKGYCANVVATFDSGLVVVPATIGFQFK